MRKTAAAKGTESAELRMASFVMFAKFHTVVVTLALAFSNPTLSLANPSNLLCHFDDCKTT